MIFRVLRENEIVDKGLGKGLYSKKFTLDNYNSCFSNALDNITTHIMKGNTSITEYISCSKNFCLDLEKYATEQLDLRPYLAIVFNHDESVLESSKYDYLMTKLKLTQDVVNEVVTGDITFEEYKAVIKNSEFLTKIYSELETSNDIRDCMYKQSPFLYMLYGLQKIRGSITSLKQSDIQKMVIDASESIYQDKIYSELFYQKLIYNKDGMLKDSYNGRERGTAKNSDEVLVLNHIPISDIHILNPLQYDILYAFLNNGSLHTIPEQFIRVLNLFSDDKLAELKNIFQTDIEKTMFQLMYIERKSILNLAFEKEFFKNIIIFKRNMVKKCIQYLNYRIRNTSVRYNDENIWVIEQAINIYDCPNIEVQGDKILKKIK